LKFAWVEWHWMAGVLLTGSIIFHIVHSTFFLDFWSIWVGPKDIPEFKAEMMREFGKEPGGPQPGKYPLGNRLYHLVVMIAGLAVIVTGVLMMWRVRNPIVDRNPYLMGDPAWGITYVLHGLGGVGFVGLIMAHIYFALRPEKLWITKSMIFGYITRRQYLEHHDPDRWKPTRAAAAASQPTGPHAA
jgi:formate dehydrogenase subunit gamma